MPAAQLLSGAIESALNTLLALDEQSGARLVPLSGKRLTLNIQELPCPLIFVFSERVDVLSTIEQVEDTECVIVVDLFTLQELQDSSQITRLIQQQRLQLDGDIHVAQDFSNLLKGINIDWPEQLSRYVGDTAAHQLFFLGNKFKTQVKKRVRQFTQIVSEGALEEKQLAAPKVAVARFVGEVNHIRSRTSVLQSRVDALLNQSEGNH